MNYPQNATTSRKVRIFLKNSHTKFGSIFINVRDRQKDIVCITSRVYSALREGR